MNLRERLLLFGVVGLAVVYLANQVVTGVFITPLRNLDAKIVRTQNTITDIKTEVALRPEIRRRLDLLRRLSLPDNLAVACSQYQRYLNERMQESGLSASLMPPTKSPAATYTLISYSLSGKTTLARLVRFLYLFYEDPLLQEIETLRLTHSGGPDSEVIQFNLKVTAMALAGTPVRSQLVPKGVPDNERPPGERLLALNESAFQPIIGKNIFLRGWKPPPPPPERERKKPTKHPPVVRAEDVNRYLRLKAIVDDSIEQIVWIENTRSSTTSHHKLGDKLSIGELALIDLYQIVIKVGDHYYKVRLGRTLADREPLTDEDRELLGDQLR